MMKQKDNVTDYNSTSFLEEYDDNTGESQLVTKINSNTITNKTMKKLSYCYICIDDNKCFPTVCSGVLYLISN